MKATRQQTIEEIADFLLANNGPDASGRGHPVKKRLQRADLEEAIALAESMGLPEGFRPYHIKSTYHVWDEKSDVNEVLIKKIDQLLEQRYNGNLVELITNTNQDELLSPLKDTLNGREVEVSMGQIGNKFKSSPFEMIKRYSQIKNRKFPYTKACFADRLETRKRRIAGEFSSLDLKKMKQPDGRYDTSIFGLKQFNSDDKTVVREVILEEALDVLQDRDIHYLGLETEQFESIRGVYEGLNLSPQDSIIIERSNRVYNAMRTMQRKATNGDKRMLSGLNIEKGAIQDKVYDIDGTYNFVNLDFVGHVSGDKERTVQGLFENDLLDDEAVIYVTLADSERDRGRSERAGYSRNQIEAVNQIMEKHAGATHEVTKLFELPYKGGTGESNRSMPMLTVGYKVRKAA